MVLFYFLLNCDCLLLSQYEFEVFELKVELVSHFPSHVENSCSFVDLDSFGDFLVAEVGNRQFDEEVFNLRIRR